MLLLPSAAFGVFSIILFFVVLFCFVFYFL